MKRKLFIFATLLFIACTFTSCQKKCEFCKLVTRDSGGTEVTSGTEAEYCDVELSAFKLANPTVKNPVTGNTTGVECHQ
jgi:hypothetical protein